MCYETADDTRFLNSLNGSVDRLGQFRQELSLVNAQGSGGCCIAHADRGYSYHQWNVMVLPLYEAPMTFFHDLDGLPLELHE